jgi:methionyl-tRNA synthetase
MKRPETANDRHAVDWSEEQLNKHSREITDLLGNFFLRVASPAIAKRLHGTTWGHSLLGHQAQKLLTPSTKARMEELATLGEHVGQLMGRFEVAQALEAVVHVLQEVNLLMFARAT